MFQACSNKLTKSTHHDNSASIFAIRLSLSLSADVIEKVALVEGMLFAKPLLGLSTGSLAALTLEVSHVLRV